MRNDEKIHTFSCTQTHTHTLDVHAHIQYDEGEKRKNERSVLCVILCCVRITRNRHGLRGKGLTDTRDITRHELE